MQHIKPANDHSMDEDALSRARSGTMLRCGSSPNNYQSFENKGCAVGPATRQDQKADASKTTKTRTRRMPPNPRSCREAPDNKKELSAAE